MPGKPDNRPILIVEDVDEISSQMGEMLLRKGQRVTYAQDAESAIMMAEQDRPRMILTDLDLPTFDLLIELVRKHGDLNRMVVAIIDINHQEVTSPGQVKILKSFAQLDELLFSTAEDRE
jgi:CheY-like chemotaxis protein